MDSTAIAAIQDNTAAIVSLTGFAVGCYGLCHVGGNRACMHFPKQYTGGKHGRNE